MSVLLSYLDYPVTKGKSIPHCTYVIMSLIMSVSIFAMLCLSYICVNFVLFQLLVLVINEYSPYTGKGKWIIGSEASLNNGRNMQISGFKLWTNSYNMSCQTLLRHACNRLFVSEESRQWCTFLQFLLRYCSYLNKKMGWWCPSIRISCPWHDETSTCVCGGGKTITHNLVSVIRTQTKWHNSWK